MPMSIQSKSITEIQGIKSMQGDFISVHKEMLLKTPSELFFTTKHKQMWEANCNLALEVVWYTKIFVYFGLHPKQTFNYFSFKHIWKSINIVLSLTLVPHKLANMHPQNRE